MTLLMACFPTAMAAAFPSSAAIKLERASRELAATFIYEAMMQGDHPLALFQEPSHKAFWFERCPAALNAELEAAALDVAEEKLDGGGSGKATGEVQEAADLRQPRAGA